MVIYLMIEAGDFFPNCIDSLLFRYFNAVVFFRNRHRVRIVQRGTSRRGQLQVQRQRHRRNR